MEIISQIGSLVPNPHSPEQPATCRQTAGGKRSHTLQALCLSALALPGLLTQAHADAAADASTPAIQSPADGDEEVGFQYGHYEEGKRPIYSQNVVINSGGSENINSGGLVSGVTVNNGGSTTINSGGMADMLIVNAGGSANIAGGMVNGGSVASGGLLNGLVLSANSLVVAQNGNETLDGISIHSGALVSLEVVSGAVLSGFVLGYNQTELIDSGGRTTGDQVMSGAGDTVNGTVSAANITNGGNLIVNSGGLANGSLIEAGGSATISAGGTMNGSIIYSGGYAVISSGGILSGGVIDSGGYAVISGGAVSGTAINGGTLEINGSTDSSQSVTFAGSNGGVLLLDQPTQFQGLISGYAQGDIIDLQGTGVSSLILGSGNLLTVNQTGGGSLTLQFNPGQTLNANNFYLTPDGNGGTDLMLHTSAPATLSSVSYNAATGILTLNGSNLPATAANGIINVNDFTLTGDSGGSYTLSSNSTLTGTPSGASVSIQLSADDQLAVDALLNKNGSQALNGAVYALSATSGWDSGATAIHSLAITVSQVQSPVLTGVSYDTATGVFTITGSNLNNAVNLHDLNLAGTAAGFIANHFTVTNLTSTGFNLSPDSAAAGNTVNSLFSANTPGLTTGPQYYYSDAFGSNWGVTGLNYTANPSAFNFSANNGWDGALSQTAAAQAITSVSDAIYNAGAGQLFLNAGAWSTNRGINPLDFTFTGESGKSYTLTNSKMLLAPNNVNAVNVIQLSSADQQAVNALLNSNGSTAIDGTAYTLSAKANWWSGSHAGGHAQTTDILVTNTPAQPSINAASYNNTTGMLTVTGIGLNNLLNLSDFKISAGTTTYQLNPASDTLSSETATSISLNLGNSGQSSLDAALATQGLSLSAIANWNGPNGLAFNNLAISISNPTEYSLVSHLLNPGALAIDSSGSLYFANNSNTLEKFTAAAAQPQTTTLAGGLNNPTAITTANGNVYFIAAGSHTIQDIAASGGTVNTLISSGLSNPSSLAAYNGNLYIADSGRNAIEEYNLNSHALSQLAVVNKPMAIAVDTAGDLYINTGSGLSELLHGSNTLTTLLTSGIGSTNNIAVDSAGNVYIADSANHAIEEYAASTHTLSILNTTGAGTPTAISIDSSGNLYIDSSNNKVEQLNHYNYLLNTPLSNLETQDVPTTLNNFWENTGQIQLSKSVFTAFAGQTAVTAAEFSNVSHINGNGATSPNDYLYYNSSNGGLYYDAGGSHGGTYLEIAVIGVNQHPTALSLGDFKLVA